MADGSRKPVPIITLIGFPLGRTPKVEISCHWGTLGELVDLIGL